jgi:hypothetical protein
MAKTALQSGRTIQKVNELGVASASAKEGMHKMCFGGTYMN